MLRSIPGLHTLALAFALSGHIGLQAAGTLPNGLYPSGSCEGRSTHYESKGWVEARFTTDRRDFYFNISSLGAESPGPQTSHAWPFLWTGSKEFWLQLQPGLSESQLILGLSGDRVGQSVTASFTLSPQLADGAAAFTSPHRAIGLALSDEQDLIALSFNSPTVVGDELELGREQRTRFVLLSREVLVQKYLNQSLARDPQNDLYLLPNEAIVTDLTIVGSMAKGRGAGAADFQTQALEMKFSPDGNYLVARNEYELEIFRIKKGKLCRLQHSISYPKMNDEFTAKHMIFSSESSILRFIAWNRDHTVREAFDLSLEHLSCVK